MNLKNKVAIVTGASSGLGAAIAMSLVQEGAAVVYAIARNKKALQNMHFQLGAKLIPICLDITHQAEVKLWVDTTFNDQHLPDILINNAGVGSFGRIDEMSSDDWYTMINTNINGLYHITSQCVPWFRKNTKATHIINIGSILGTTSRAEATAYSATKYAINGLSDALYKELRGDNIKVTCVNPGSIETEFFHSSGIITHSNMLQAKDLADTILHILKTPDNMLINEITIRPLNPKSPSS